MIAVRFLATFLCLMASTAVVRSQATFKPLGAPDKSNSPVVRDAIGRPCLDVDAASRAHTVNRDVVDHVVSVQNKCSRMIKVKVCYFQTDNCKEFQVQGYSRVDTILGTMNKSWVFRYTIFQN